MIANLYKKSRLALAAAALAGLGVAGAAQADDSNAGVPNNTVRAGVYIVHFDSSAQDLSGPFTPAGINLSVDNVSTMYLGYIRRLNDHWDVELAGGIPPTTHTRGAGPATLGSVPLNGQEVATAKWFSPSVLLEYKFFDESAKWRPYVGVGVNYTYFYNRDSTAAGNAANGGPTHIDLSHSFGPAGTVGLMYKFDRNWNVAASYSLARVNSDYQSDTSGVMRTTTIHFNPRAAVLAVGYSF